jgi:hypothetical protein
MANTAATKPGTVVDSNAVGTLTWANPSNAIESDNAYAATSDPGVGTYYSHYLKATNFGFAIPAGATINGIVVTYEKQYVNAGVVYDNEIRIVKADGAIGTTNKAATATVWPSTDASNSYGSSTDLWGETWDADKINDIDFGVVLSTKHYRASRCLQSDTLVWTKDEKKAIKNIEVGERIYSFNEKTGQIEEDTVTASWHRSIGFYGNKYFCIYTDSGEPIQATFNHEFYVNGEWKDAESLRVGDVLTNEQLESVTVKRIDVIDNSVDDVWDLTVENNHNFFAGEILVHNAYAAVDQILITIYYTEAAPSGPALLKTVNGLAVASVKTLRSGLAIASGKTFNGLA